MGGRDATNKVATITGYLETILNGSHLLLLFDYNVFGIMYSSEKAIHMAGTKNLQG